MIVQNLRYHLPKKAIKGDCPQCGPKHRRTLSRYIDIRTGEPLPLEYGRCDRESNCAYHLSPYHVSASGMSYADVVYQQWKADNPLPAERGPARSTARQHGQYSPDADNSLQTWFLVPAKQPQLLSSTPSAPEPVYSIPDEVFRPAINHYNRNQFARLLDQQFGPAVASELLQRFQIGTSAYWPGACVFWLIDEQHRARAGQVVLFADDWHKARYTRENKTKVCISSVSHSLLRRYRQQQQPAPVWLADYHDNAPRWPILFGLHQLSAAPADQPIAIVEAPKTAVICSHYYPGYIWLAFGTKSNFTLNTTDGLERVRSLRNRSVTLCPDLNAYHDWSQRANQLRAEGFTVEVSDYLEQHATDDQKRDGLDLADFLLQQPPTVSTLAEQLARPSTWLRPNPTDVERLPAIATTDQPGKLRSMATDQNLPILITSTHRPLLAALARCLQIPIEDVPLYRLNSGQ